MLQENIRNIAIIAHVDHGKTTLVDRLLQTAGIFRENQQVEERVLDSNDQERERGITILSKNVSIRYKDVKINVIDTPGHADFGGEVERVLKMADGVLLLVDAFEGPMPQTRFVLKHALNLDLVPIVVINKIDRPGARPDEVLDEVFELMLELGASDEQLDFTTIYASAMNGYARLEPDDGNMDMLPLLDAILEHIPAPDVDPNGPVAMQICTVDHSEYVGRIGTGRLFSGSIEAGQQVLVLKNNDAARYETNVKHLYTFEALGREEAQSAEAGDIIAIVGVEDASVETPEEYAGKIIELFGTAGGEMTNMATHQDQTVLSFKIPTRGIMGLRTKILNASHGEAIFSHRFSEYGPMRGELGGRKNGAMVAMHSDKAVAYALDTLQQRGTLYVEPGDECYEGMIVGENAKEGDMDVNVSKTKQLGNQRASSADKAIMLTPPVKFTLEEALEYIADDELVEITPKSIRLRKRTLDKIGRKKERARALGK